MAREDKYSKWVYRYQSLTPAEAQKGFSKLPDEEKETAVPLRLLLDGQEDSRGGVPSPKHFVEYALPRHRQNAKTVTAFYVNWPDKIDEWTWLSYGICLYRDHYNEITAIVISESTSDTDTMRALHAFFPEKEVGEAALQSAPFAESSKDVQLGLSQYLPTPLVQIVAGYYDSTEALIADCTQNNTSCLIRGNIKQRLENLLTPSKGPNTVWRLVKNWLEHPELLALSAQQLSSVLKAKKHGSPPVALPPAITGFLTSFLGPMTQPPSERLVTTLQAVDILDLQKAQLRLLPRGQQAHDDALRQLGGVRLLKPSDALPSMVIIAMPTADTHTVIGTLCKAIPREKLSDGGGSRSCANTTSV